MKRWLDLINQKVSRTHRQKVLSAAEIELAKLRPEAAPWWQRREWALSMAAIALTVTGIFSYRRFNQTPDLKLAVELEESEIAEDIDFLADLEFLESWDESEDV